MDLYLHIGLSKTGTTAIQKFLWDKKKLIFEKYNILYPEKFVDKDLGLGHHVIPFSLRKKYPISFNQIIKEFRDLLASLIKDTKVQAIILSSEEFIFTNPEDLIKIFKDEFLHLKILIYLRRQDLWFESLYKEVIKNPIGNKLNKTKSFQSFIKNIPHFKIANYFNFLSHWQFVFPGAKIILRIYDRKLFPEGNVILDFLSALEVDIPEARDYKIDINPSISHLSALVLRKMNTNFQFPPEIYSSIVNFLLKLDKEKGSPIKSFFTLKERINLLNYFKESNEKFFKKWLKSKNKFILTDEEIEFYKQQDEILKDKEYIEKLIEERYENILEFLKENYPNFEEYKLDKELSGNIHTSVSDTEVIGKVEKITPIFIEGWVANLKKKRPAKVFLEINGKPVAEAEANIPIYSLMERLKLDIPFGFRIYWNDVKLPREFHDNDECILRVVEKESGKILPGNYVNLKVEEVKKFIQFNFPHIIYNWDVINNYFEIFHIDKLHLDLLKGTIILKGKAYLKKYLKKKDYMLILKTQRGEKDLLSWRVNPIESSKINLRNLYIRKATFLKKNLSLADLPLELCIINKKEKSCEWIIRVSYRRE